MADSPDGHNSETKELEGQEQVWGCSVVEFGTPDIFAFADLEKQH